MRSRSLLAISASALLATSTALVTASASSAAPARGPPRRPVPDVLRLVRASAARSAAAYVVPDDVTQVWSTPRPDGATQTRYQQVVGGAAVFGGQITVHPERRRRDRDGRRRPLPGPAGPATRPRSARREAAQQVVEDRIGTARHVPQPRCASTRSTGPALLPGAEHPRRRSARSAGSTPPPARSSRRSTPLTEGTGHRRQGRHQDDRHHQERRQRLPSCKTGDDRQETYDAA